VIADGLLERFPVEAMFGLHDLPGRVGQRGFGVFGEVVPTCFAFLGNGVEIGAGGTPLHSSDYNFNYGILDTGVAYLVRTALPS
jgi:hippurate hydrolase